MSESQAKWDRRYQQCRDELPNAAEVLAQNQHLLPKTGTALDLACGLGANAILLARAGLNVTAQDISPVAIQQLQQTARQSGVEINAEVCDVMITPPSAEQYNVIVVSYFLERSLAPALINALKPGGLLFYQTWCLHKTAERGPTNPDFLLAENELLSLFADLTVRIYREESGLGDVSQGFRDRAMMVAERVV
ncbi:MAG TPA: methyltransferase domain-containing protein [Methylophaga sp.]|nr:methyltransferase domain-containing protein [Methylophaga sp.]